MGQYSAARRERAEVYLPTELDILSKHFGVPPDAIAVADDDLDQREATDLTLPDGTRIAKRVRNPDKIKHYGTVVFRHQPNPAYPTEWEKVIGGCARYLLYSIARDEADLACWWLLDLDALRLADRTDYFCAKVPEEVAVDEDDGMMVIRLDGFPSVPPLVVASSEPMPGSTDGVSDRCRRLSASRRCGASATTPAVL